MTVIASSRVASFAIWYRTNNRRCSNEKERKTDGNANDIEDKKGRRTLREEQIWLQVFGKEIENWLTVVS
jgi:hypothetical protein